MCSSIRSNVEMKKKRKLATAQCIYIYIYIYVCVCVWLAIFPICETLVESDGGECVRPPTPWFLSLFSYFFLVPFLSIVLSCIHRCPVYLFFEPDTRVRELYIWTIWEKKRKRRTKKNYSIVADHYIYTIVLCPVKWLY